MQQGIYLVLSSFVCSLLFYQVTLDHSPLSCTKTLLLKIFRSGQINGFFEERP